MFKLPACTLAEFCNNNVTVAEHFNIKVDMEAGLKDQISLCMSGRAKGELTSRDMNI